MYHMEGEAVSVFRREGASLESVRGLLDLAGLFPEFKTDDHLFEPWGYSLNGIFEDRYITFHVTPEQHSSYISFETNLKLEEHSELFTKILEVFQPQSFDIVHFHERELPSFGERYQLAGGTNDRLECGYPIKFGHFIKRQLNLGKALRL